MFGRIAIEPAARAFQMRSTLVREELCGVPFLLGRAYFLPGDSASRRRRILRRLSRRMTAAGVRQAILPPRFPYESELAAAGITPFPTLGLYRAIAPQLALTGLREAGTAPEDATIVLSGIRMNRSLWGTAFALCKQVRYLVVDVDDDGGAVLRRKLREHCGLPSLMGGDRQADFTLFYQPKVNVPADGPGFLLCPEAKWHPSRPRLYRGALLRLPPGMAASPPDCAAEPLMAAFYALGRIRTEQITVERLTETAEPSAFSDPG